MKEKIFYKKGFLLLERKPGCGFHIGEQIEIVITEVKEGKATIAIKAPGFNVLRNEIIKNGPRI